MLLVQCVNYFAQTKWQLFCVYFCAFIPVLVQYINWMMIIRMQMLYLLKLVSLFKLHMLHCCAIQNSLRFSVSCSIKWSVFDRNCLMFACISHLIWSEQQANQVFGWCTYIVSQLRCDYCGCCGDCRLFFDYFRIQFGQIFVAITNWHRIWW